MWQWLERLFHAGAHAEQPSTARVIQEMRALPTRYVWSAWCQNCGEIVELTPQGICKCRYEEMVNCEFRWIR